MQRPKRRWWRIASVTIAIVVVLLAAVLTWLVSADHQHLRDDAENILSDVLGRDVFIDGSMHLLLGRKVEFSVSNLRIAATDWSDNEDLLRLGTLTATVDTLSLLSDSIIVDTLAVDGLQVFLQTSSEGGNNWTLGRESSGALPNQDGERPTIPLKVHNLTVNSSKLSYTPANGENLLTLQIDSLSESIKTDRRVVLTLDGDINETPFNIAASTDDIDKLNALQDVAFNLDASLGEVRLTSEIAIEDLLNPTQPRASLRLTGPNAEYLTDVLQFDRVTTGPLSLSLEILPNDDRMDFDLNGTVGEFVVVATGIFDNLQNLQDAEFDISASGPNARRVSALFGVDGVPENAFDTKGSIRVSGPKVSLVDAQLNIGTAKLDANANFENFPGVDGATAQMQIRGPAVEDFSELTSMSEEVAGPFSVDLNLSAQADSTADVEATVIAAGSELRAAGNITDHTGLNGSRLELRFSTPSLSRYSALTGISGLPALPLNIQATLERKETATRLDSATINLADDILLLTGTVGDEPLQAITELSFDLQLADTVQTLSRFDIDATAIATAPLTAKGKLSALDGVLSARDVSAKFGDAEVNIDGNISDLTEVPKAKFQVSASGPNLASLLSSSERDLTTAFQISTNIDVAADLILLDAIELRFDRTSFSGSLQFNREAPWSDYQADIEGNSTDIAALASAFTDVKTEQRIPMKFDLQGNGKNGGLRLDALTLNFGDAVLQASGSIAEPPAYTGTELRLDLEIPDLSYVAGITGASLPAEQMSLSLLLESVADGLIVEDLKLQLGDSVVNGDISFRDEGVPYLKIDLNSALLDLSSFVDDPAEPDENGAAAVAPAEKQGSSTRLIPDTPVSIEILRRLNADLSVAIDRLVIDQRQHTDFAVAASVKDGALSVDTFKLTGEYGGKLWGRFVARPEPAGVEFGMRLFGENVEVGLPAQTEEEQRALPRYDLKLAFITRGRTIREMAGAVNGYLKVVSGEGVLRTGMMSIFTQDFLFELLQSINPFLKSDPYTKLKCMAILATVEDGQVAGNPVLVAQSERLKIVAKTRIDLKTEKVDADFNTVAQKGLGISLNDLVNPYVKVGGTLSSPALRFDQNSALIQGGAAVATGGISILAKSFAGRFLGANDPCGQAVVDAEEQFEKLERKYGGTAMPVRPGQ